MLFVHAKSFHKKNFKQSQETSFCSHIQKYFYWCSGTNISLLLPCSLLCFCLVVSLCFLCFLVLLVQLKSFCKKNKKFKTALMTSFTLPLNLSYYKHEFFLITILFNYHNSVQLSQSFSIISIFFNHHNSFQLSQSFSIITILFNQYNTFQSLQSVSIITIFFNYHNLLYYNLFQLSQSSLLQSFLISSFLLQLLTLSI